MGMHRVRVSFPSTERFEPVQLLLRLGLLLVLGLVGASLGWLLAVLYVGLPVVAAVLVSRDGAERFRAAHAPRLSRVLGWVVAFLAYLLLVTDRFPDGSSRDAIRLEVDPDGEPTAGSALVRLVLGLPSLLVFALLLLVAALVWIVGALFILLRSDHPRALQDFQRGVVTWAARLYAYQASLVVEYPPFSLSAGGAPLPAA